MWCLLVLSLLQQPESDIRVLIENLGSDKIEVREVATEKLKRIGDAAKPALESATKSRDAETAARARRLLRYFEVRAKLTPALLKAIPDAADRLVDPDVHAWTEVFLEATSSVPKVAEPKYPNLTRNDLEALAGPAVEGAREKRERAKVIGLVRRWRLASALPAVEKSLSDPDEEVRMVAVMCLRMGGPETTPKIAAALKDESSKVRMQAIGILCERKERKYIGEFREMLEKGPPESKQMLLNALIYLEGKATARVDVLRHVDSMKGEGAAQVLGLLGDPSQASKLFKMTGDKDEYVRGAAMNALCQLGARQYLDDMLRWLDDEGSDKRLSAAGAVARLGRPEHGAKMLFMLKADDYSLRRGGLRCLQLLDAPEYVKEIRPLLHDPQWLVRADAAAALNSLGASLAPDLLPLIDPSDPRFCPDAGPMMAVADMAMRESADRQDEVALVLKKLEGNPSRELADGASIALVRLGRKDRAAQYELALRLANTSPRWRIRHHMYLGESFALANEPRLRESIEVKTDVESIEDINALLKPWGLKVEVELPIRVAIRKGRRMTLFEVVRRVPEPLAPVLEKGVIRLMHHESYPLDRWCELLK